MSVCTDDLFRVTCRAKDPEKPVDVVTARVVETFKGPEAAGVGTLTVRLSNLVVGSAGEEMGSK